MECSEVKKFLQSFIDDELERELKQIVKLHLSSCNSCNKELESLLSYKNSMRSLPKLTAPDNFLKELHERIDNPSFFKRMIDKLFYPLNIKLPLEAAGVLATVVIIVFLYNPISGPLKNEMSPVSKAGDQSFEAERDDRLAGLEQNKLRNFNVNTRKSVDTRTPPVKREVRFAQKPADKAAAPGFAGQNELVTYELALLIRQPNEENQFKGHLDMEESVSSKDILREKSPLKEKRGKYKVRSKKSLGVAVKSEISKSSGILEDINEEKEIKDSGPVEKAKTRAADDIIKMAVGLKGKVIKKELNAKTKSIEYIVLGVPSANYNTFIEKVKKIGVVQKDNLPDPGKAGGMQTLRIQLIYK